MAGWFEGLDLSQATTSQRSIVQRVVELLDLLDPARLEPRHQTAELLGDGAVEFTLRHDTESWLEIEARIGPEDAVFYGVMGFDETYSPDHRGQGEDDAVETLADLLQASYSRRTRTVGGRPWQTVTDISASTSATVALPEGRWGLLPLGFWARSIDISHASFECRPADAGKDQQSS